jgi:cysteine synthase/rhodanese-related sulfurtransferase
MADHKRRVYEDMLDLVSSPENPTPMVRINRVTPFKHTQVFAKLEWYNPFGAVKDRIAYNLICDAEEKGHLSQGQKLVEPTSGNTGMGLAMVGNLKGYSLTTPLSNQIPLEKRTVLRLFGSKVIELEDNLCPAPGAPEGAIAKAHELGAREDFHMLNQYANKANPQAHYKTTGPEIWQQSEGKITHFVAGLGSCGTISGVGHYLKERDPNISVLGVHPMEGHDIPGVRSLKQLEQTELFEPSFYDGLTGVENSRAYELCLRLNREESIICAPSSAMALAGAFDLIEDKPGHVVVVIFPDNIFKYASSALKHLPELRTESKLDPKISALNTMVENIRHNQALNLPTEQGHQLWQQQEAVFIDVRGFDQHRLGHVPDCLVFPIKEADAYQVTLPEDKTTPIVTFCNRGNLSLRGVLHLLSLGYTQVKSLQGGMNAWEDAGYQTAKD